MQEETVDYKMDVSDESIKRNAMKVVWMFSGVTFADVKEKGQLKVRGNFDKYLMGTRLQQIDKSVDIINPMQKTEQNHISVISSIPNYFNAPKVQEIVVFEFKILNEHIKPEAMEGIWEFSGITSVEVEENRRVKVKGEEFNKLEMLTKLQNIDESVKITSFGPDVEAELEVKQAFNNGSSNWTNFAKFNIWGNKQSDASSSKGPTPAPLYGAAGARARAAAEKEKAQTPVNNWPVDKAIEIIKVPVIAGLRVLNNLKPPVKQQHNHNCQAFDMNKAEKLRIEREKEKQLQIQKANKEKLRIEQEKAEKLRMEQEKAEKLRIEKKRAEKLRMEQEKAEKLRIEKKRAEKLRMEQERANKQGSSTWNTEGNTTQSWLAGSTSMGLSKLWNTTQSTLASSTLNPFQTTQSTGTTGSTQYQNSTKNPRKESQ